MNIDISIDSDQWSAVENLETLVRDATDAAKAVVADRSFRNAELSVAFVSDETIRMLNRDYRGKDKATNVLSFPGGEPTSSGMPRMLGDVILAYETVAVEAAGQRKPIEHHISHLVVHGFLHLLGYDHESAKDAETMEAIEISALERLRIANPYLSDEETLNHEAAGKTGALR